MQNYNNLLDLRAKKTREAKSAWLKIIKPLVKLVDK
jgi:hypothetical protein